MSNDKNTDLDEFDRSWHLSTTAREIAITELEFSLIRSYEAFSRWQVEGIAAASGKSLSASDCALLNVIAMRKRPKGITEVARLLNRDDITNVQYTIRKLMQENLIEKTTKDRRKKGVFYRTTTQGMAVIDKYVSIRQHLLVKLTETMRGLNIQMENASQIMDLMTGIYEQASRVAATHRKPVEEMYD